MEAENRFWLLDYWPEDHEEDLISSALICIVDEEAGGIIAYAVSEDYAKQILNGLEAINAS